MQVWERAINALSVRRPQPHNITHRQNVKKGKIVEDKKKERAARPIKVIGPVLEIRQSHTIEHRVSKIIPERVREGNKIPVVLLITCARL